MWSKASAAVGMFVHQAKQFERFLKFRAEIKRRSRNHMFVAEIIRAKIFATNEASGIYVEGRLGSQSEIDSMGLHNWGSLFGYNRTKPFGHRVHHGASCASMFWRVLTSWVVLHVLSVLKRRSHGSWPKLRLPTWEQSMQGRIPQSEL